MNKGIETIIDYVNERQSKPLSISVDGDVYDALSMLAIERRTPIAVIVKEIVHGVIDENLIEKVIGS